MKLQWPGRMAATDDGPHQAGAARARADGGVCIL
eukprot:COSAG06_NODE_3265_length_5594_cov_4.359054_1_plen_33_part_10